MGVGAGTSGSPLTPPLSAPTLHQVEAAWRLRNTRWVRWVTLR